MSIKVRSDAQRSNGYFTEFVNPVLQTPGWPTNGEIVPVEYLGNGSGLKNDPLRDVLDMHSGIDYVQLAKPGCVRGIASRVQPCDQPKPWNTFTIRARRDSGSMTELEKRRLVFSPNERWRGWLAPYLTLQAYVYRPPIVGGGIERLLSVGLTMTADLVAYIDDGDEGIDWQWQRTSNALFVVVPWGRFRESGKRFWMFDASDEDVPF